MASVIAMVLCVAMLSCCAFAKLSSEYAHNAVLDPEEKMKLFWTIDWDDESVSFAVECEDNGMGRSWLLKQWANDRQRHGHWVGQGQQRLPQPRAPLDGKMRDPGNEVEATKR